MIAILCSKQKEINLDKRLAPKNKLATRQRTRLAPESLFKSIRGRITQP